MLLTRKSEAKVQPVNPLARAVHSLASKTVDRRTFLKGTGLTAGAAAFASQLPLNVIGQAHAQSAKAGNTVVKRTVCTHCSVGCSIDGLSPTACGSARNRCSIPPSIWVRTAPRAPRCASTG